VKGGDEAVHLVGHVGLGEPLEVVEHVGETVVEVLLERLDLLLGEDAFVLPPAVRAAQHQVPALSLGLRPSDRLDQVGIARGAEVQTPRGRSLGLVVETDDLDALAAGEHNLANGVIFGIVVHGGTSSDGPLIGANRGDLERLGEVFIKLSIQRPR
jgi:hypothetical protein